MNQLLTAALHWRPPMKDTDEVLKKKIMAHVRAEKALADPLSIEI